MKFPRLFTKLFCDPLMITATAFSGLANGLIARAAAPMTRASVTPDQRPDEDYLIFRKRMEATDHQVRLEKVYRVIGSIAIITIDGVIDRHISIMEMDCYGGCDLADVDRAIALAKADAAIKTVFIEFRTPGGSVIGVAETAQQVAELDQVKPVYGFSDTICGSAGYYIASQCRRLYGTSSSVWGSIGVYCAILDASGWYEEQKMKMNFFKDGDFKGAGLDFKPLTPDEAKMFQDRVLQLGALFRNAVTSKRPQVELATMQGQTFIGRDVLDSQPDAYDVGLIDDVVLSLDQLLGYAA